jgi:magnesium transporter
VISTQQTQTSVRQNDSIRQLTLIATVFLPLTFLTGFFGQNFAWLVEHTDSLLAFLVLGLAGQLLAILVLYTWLRRGGHVRPSA